jgi:alkanesulfonate monooxygenase SsuD/methylene tetrahydromethanopterin reductase-like flavin-dependent oxidoreductase (luciferase family)
VAPQEPFMEGWTVISALAAVTSKIRLATLVTSVAYRNPALLAKMAAGVDIISRGRLTFGIGAGWYQEEYKEYGYVFPEKPAVRIHQLAEAVKLVKLMWHEQRATFHGKYFHIENAILEPKPVQKPHPPIMIGGGGEQLTLKVLAQEGDACNLFGSPEVVKHKLDVLRKHCETVGRDYEQIERTNLASLLLARDEGALAAKRNRLGIPPDLRVNALTVSQVTDLVGRYQNVGIQTFVFSTFRNDQESLDLIASDVIPQFA